MVVVSVLPLTGLAIVGAGGGRHIDGEGVGGGGGRNGAAGRGLRRGDRVAGVAQGGLVGVKLQALLTTAAVPATGSIDATRDRVAVDAAAGNGRLGGRRIGAAVDRAGDRRRRRCGRHIDGEGVGGGGGPSWGRWPRPASR